MKKAQNSKPIDVSKGLFMDLAFILIATLVLLVQEPSKRKQIDAGFFELRRSSVEKVEEKELEGESIFLEIVPNGEVFEVLYDDQKRILGIDQISNRIDQMPREEDRIVVLFFNQNAPYSKVASALDEVSKLQQAGKINKIYEIVGKE